MKHKVLLLLAFLFLNFSLLSGQTIHYDYDDSGNRQIRYIVLGKGNASSAEFSKKYEEEVKAVKYEDEQEEFTVKIYPNPTRSNLTVKITGLLPDETVNYKLFTQSGLLLIQKIKNSHQFSIDMDSYPSGLYLLNLEVQDKISHWKILKE